MGLARSIRLATRTAVRHPRQTWRRVSSQKLKALVRLLAVLPPRARRATGGVLAAVARPLIRRRRDHPVGAPLGVLSRWAAGRAAEAIALAERIGSDPETDRRTVLRLARACLALDAVDAAGRILDSLRERDGGEDRTALALRADVALRTGRYAAAADLARRSGTVPAILERARGELRAIDPAWIPRLPGGAPLATPARGRILHLLTNSLPYRQAGYTIRSQAIARAQLDAGLDPHLATRAGFPLSHGIPGAPREDRIDGVPYHRLEPNLDPTLGPDRIAEATARAAATLVESLRPAALHPASNALNAKVALALRDRYGLPVVYEVRGFLEETWLARRGVDDPAADRYGGAKASETAAMIAADAVVTLSETMKADIVARGVSPDRVVVVPNAVDTERFVPMPRDEALAARLGIGPADVVLGYVSSLSAYEGVGYLIQAAALLRRRGRPVRVLVVGDGEALPDLRASAGRHGVDDGTVIFAGRVPHGQIRSMYSIIDVFVVPRTADRVSQLVTPLKPYEAMAMERAIVVSGVDALRELVREGETGLVFRPEDPEDLANVVEPLLGDPGRRLELGRAAREWVAANRTWRQNGNRYRELYERLGVA